MVGNKHGIFAQFETIRPLQPLKNVASPAWQASLRRCMEHFNGEWERGSRLRGLLVQGIAPIDFPLDGLLDEVRPHLSPLLRIANYQAVWDGPELPRLSGRDAAGKLLVQVNPIQTVYVFGADGRKEEHGDGSRYAELAEMAGNVLNQLPPEVSRTIWGDWATGFYCRESKALWTAAVFRLAWKGKLAVISKRVAWDGATTRVLETTAADSRFFAELDDLYSASREAAQYLLELPATIEVVPTTTDATRGTDKSEGDGAKTKESKPDRPLSKREVIRRQRIKFTAPRRTKGEGYQSIYEAYHRKYPNDTKADADALRHAWDRRKPGEFGK